MRCASNQSIEGLVAFSGEDKKRRRRCCFAVPGNGSSFLQYHALAVCRRTMGLGEGAGNGGKTSLVVPYAWATDSHCFLVPASYSTESRNDTMPTTGSFTQVIHPLVNNLQLHPSQDLLMGLFHHAHLMVRCQWMVLLHHSVCTT